MALNSNFYIQLLNEVVNVVERGTAFSDPYFRGKFTRITEGEFAGTVRFHLSSIESGVISGLRSQNETREPEYQAIEDATTAIEGLRFDKRSLWFTLNKVI